MLQQQHNASSNMLQPIPLKRKVMILQPTMNLGSLAQIILTFSTSWKWHVYIMPSPSYPCRQESGWLWRGWWISDTKRKVSAPSGMGSSVANQPTAQSLLSPLPSPSEPILIYKIQESDNSMQIVDNKPACVETANSSIYSCNHLKGCEGVRNTSPLIHATHRAMPEFCY